MSINQNRRIKVLTKTKNSQKNKKINFFISENNNENIFSYPKMPTMSNTSRNFYTNKLFYKSSKNISNKIESKYFMSESKNLHLEKITKKFKKYKSNLNIKDIKKENIEEYKDYSTIMKHLEKWDKEHCYTSKNKGDSSSLYNNLINYYKDNNLINEEKNLNYIDNMMKAKEGFRYFFYNGYSNQNKLLKELIMRSPKKTNINNDNKEDEKINENKINKEDDVFINLLNKKKEDKKNNDFYPNKVFKEKIKYEKELHQKLLFINNLLFNKKYIKDEKKKLLDKLYETKNKLVLDYNEKNSKDIKLYWLKYDEYDYTYKKKMEIFKPEGIKERSPQRKSVAYNHKNSLFSSQIKNMEYMKKSQLSSLNMEMLRKQKKLKTEYIQKVKKINQQKDILENDIKIINRELEYYKHANNELLREYKNYYMDILKQGADIRKDGLLWVVKNLIELQINLEYQHFPKYLTHEQINYLKNLAFISLEENELKIIISVLKKKQSNERINDNIERMNLVDTLMIDKNKDDTNKKNIYENDELMQKFYKIYKNNKIAFKFALDKNEEEIKIRNILIQIKKGIYSIGDNFNQKNKNFIKENTNSILNAFMGKTKDKDLFNLILSIRQRLIDLDNIKKNLIEKEKENYNDSLKFIGNNSYIDKTLVKELIKQSLFGIKHFEVD